MRGHLFKSEKERQRLLVLSRIKDQGMSIRKASEVLELGYRHTRRVYKRFINEGEEGLIHKSRGIASSRGLRVETKQSVINLYKTKYDGFGPTLATEKLLKENGIALDHETLRRWLIKEGLWQRRRKRSTYRQYRKPREQFGELIQMDGSHHPWFEERGEKCCLMNMVDDATKTTLSLMDKEETTEVSMRLLWAWIDKYGIPEALYVDHKNVFVTDREPTMEEQLKGEVPLTHFGRACDKLGIQIICANSPQAKGRVERNHGVYQDRLVKEFRLKGTNTIGSANQILTSGFVDDLNARFSVVPQNPKDRHLPVDNNTDLRAIFCFEYQRSIGNDFTVRFDNRIFQVSKQNPLPPARAKLRVQKRLDESIHLIYENRELEFSEITNAPREEPATVSEEKAKKSTAHTPSANHPWRSKKRSRHLVGATP